MDLVQLWQALPRDLKGCFWFYTQPCYAPVPPPFPDEQWTWKPSIWLKDFTPYEKQNKCDQCRRHDIGYCLVNRSVYLYLCLFCTREMIEDCSETVVKELD